MTEHEAMEWFVDALFADAADDDHLISICGRNPAGAWSIYQVPTVAEAVHHGQAFADDDMDVYIGAGLVRPGLPPGARGSAADVRCITGVWADVDIGSRTTGKDHPPTEESARQAIARIGPTPSCIVHSGHGLQPWWLLTEPLENADAAKLLNRWRMLVLTIFRLFDWHVDSVWDLSRIMRLPGTLNHGRKDALPEEVRNVPVDVRITVTPLFPLRYDVDTLLGWTVDNEFAEDANPHALVHVAPLELKPTEGLHEIASKISVLLANDRDFANLWNKKITQPSDSEYDYHIAYTLAAVGYDDQQIADAIRWWRRLHSQNPAKADRRSYLTRTIGVVRQRMSQQKAWSEVVSPAGKDNLTNGDGIRADRRKQTQDVIEKAIGLRIHKFIRRGSGDPTYELVLADGRTIYLGGAADLLDARKVRAAILAYARHVIERPKERQWSEFVRRLQEIAVHEEVLDAHPLERARGYLQEYLSGASTERWEDQARSGGPFVYKECFWISPENFRHWCITHKGGFESLGWIRSALSQLNWKGSVQVWVPPATGAAPRVIRRWALPVKAMEEHHDSQDATVAGDSPPGGNTPGG